MENTKFNYADIVAIEAEARRMRARAVADLLSGFGRWIAARFAALRHGQARSA